MRRAIALLVVVVTACVLAVPAGAQLFGDRYPFDYRGRRAPPPQQQQQQYFPFPFFNPGERQHRAPRREYVRPAQPVESTKAPPPRKQDTPPTSNVVVIGDSMADWLAYGLDETFGNSPETGIVRKIRPNSGLVRYEPRSDTPEWSQALKDILGSEKPSAIVVMLGLNDRQSIREHVPQRPSTAQRNADAQPPAGQAGQAQPPPSPTQPPQNGEPPPAAQEPTRAGATHEFRTDQWAEVYAKRIDDMIAGLKSKGVPILWVGLPAIRGPRSTGDISYLDDLYRSRAEKAGIVYVDVWDGFVDDSGRFAMQGPDFEGQTRRLRTGDGVHFTKAGAIKLAHYVDRELRRAMSKSVVPVALPAPEEPLPAPAKPGVGVASRPAAGAVVPLTATTGDEDELLGGGGKRAATPPPADPTATRVLTRGETVAAPTGRSDDFAWPRRGFTATGLPIAQPEPVALTPPAAPPGAKASAGRADAKKSKTDGKNQPAQDASPIRTRKAPRAQLDGAPRPPLPIGPSVSAGPAR